MTEEVETRSPLVLTLLKLDPFRDVRLMKMLPKNWWEDGITAYGQEALVLVLQ